MTASLKLALHTKILRIMGVSLNEKDGFLYKVYSLLVTCVLWSYPVSLLQANLTNHYNLDVLLENTAFIFASVNACLTLMAILRVRKPLGRLLHLMETGRLVPSFPEMAETEEKLFSECNFYINTQLLVLYGFEVANIICIVTATFTARLKYSDPQRWVLPYGKFAVFNVTYSPNFELAFIYQDLGINMIAVAVATLFSFITGLMAYVSYQCKILQSFIKKSIQYSSAKMCMNQQSLSAPIENSTIEWKYLKQTLKEVVEVHSAIINMAEQIEDLVNVPMLIFSIGVSTVICLTLLSASAFPTFNLHLLNQVLLAGAHVFLQFIMTYWGDEVIKESEKLSKACYEVDFVGVDIKFQKGVIRVMERSQIPLQFTVGKFAPLSMNMFVQVLKTAYSYYTMLCHFKKS